jgi:hypothetical protein
MSEGQDDVAPAAPSPEGTKPKVPPYAVIAVLIVAMLIIAALGISMIKIDQTAMHRIAWNADDELNYSGTTTVDNVTNGVSITCLGPSTDLGHPGFGVMLSWGFQGRDSRLTTEQPIPYDLRDNRGSIVGQEQISTAFGAKWIDVWTNSASYYNGSAWQMVILTASIGHNTGLVYEASMMGDGTRVHIGISNSTNAELWRADLEQGETAQCKGAKVTESEGNRVNEGAGSVYGAVVVLKGQALHYEIHGSSIFMHVLSVQDLFGIASGDFSFNETLSVLTGTSGVVNAIPPPGVYYIYLDMQTHVQTNYASMYWTA